MIHSSNISARAGCTTCNRGGLTAACVLLFAALLTPCCSGAEVAAVITDAKGKEITLTKVTTERFSVQVGDSVSVVPVDRIVRIDALVPGKNWRITQTRGKPVEGKISGNLAGEWALGKYAIEMLNIKSVVFPNRKEAASPAQSGVAKATDSKGATIDLSAITTKSFSMDLGAANATVVLDRVAEIAKLKEKDGLWQVSLLNAPALRGKISGHIQGEWALGKYSAKADQLKGLSFPKRSAATSWPEKPAGFWAARLTLVGDIDLRATKISMVPRTMQYDYGGDGGGQHIDKSTLLALEHGGADLLIDLRKVRTITTETGTVKVTLADGSSYDGKLSKDYMFEVETSWGSVTFPHSSIVDAALTAGRITKGIDAKAEKAIGKLFEHAAFSGTILTKQDKSIHIDAFVLEYSNKYKYYSTEGYIMGGTWVSGHRHFAAIRGIPCKVGDSLVDLEPSKIQALAIPAGTGSPRKVQVTAAGGTTVEAILADNENPDGLKKYHDIKGSHYFLVGILARSDFGYVRMPMKHLKEIRRAAR